MKDWHLYGKKSIKLCKWYGRLEGDLPMSWQLDG